MSQSCLAARTWECCGMRRARKADKIMAATASCAVPHLSGSDYRFNLSQVII